MIRKRAFNETGTDAAVHFSPQTILPQVKEMQGIADMVDAPKASAFFKSVDEKIL